MASIRLTLKYLTEKINYKVFEKTNLIQNYDPTRLCQEKDFIYLSLVSLDFDKINNFVSKIYHQGLMYHFYKT